MSFSIRLTPTERDATLGMGIIVIDGFQETFRTDLSFWSATTYKKHWFEAARRVVEQGNGALFISSITDPSTSNFISVWPCYRVQDMVFFQHHVLFLDELEEPFDPLSPHDSLPTREAVTEDGETISQWVTNITELRRFYEAET
ncbi:MAG: hypothetical protein ACRBN8_25375 [Nannocystales bacterium]